MSAGQIVFSLVVSVLIVWLCARAANKPRTTPKIPRDRSQDAQLVFWVRFF